MKTLFILLAVALVIILFLFIGICQRNQENNILLIQNNFLNDNLCRILISKKELKEDLNKKIKHINTVETELEAIHKLAQNLRTDKKMLQMKLEEELEKREIAEANLKVTTNKIEYFEHQIAALNKEITLYKDELNSIYAMAGIQDSYGIKLSKKIELSKEGQVPYGRVVVASKQHNFIIVTPFNEKIHLAYGTAIEIYNGDERIALGSVKDIKNNFVLVDKIISYSTERYIEKGDLALVEKIALERQKYD